jgi:hypothetical protein
MGEEYQFRCLECELEITLGREKGGSPPIDSLIFYYHESSSKNTGNTSTLTAMYSIGILDNHPDLRSLEVINHEGEIIVNCPECSSNHTLVYKLDNWMEDYQVW